MLKKRFFSKPGLLSCWIIFVFVLGLMIWLVPFFWHRSKLVFYQRNYEFTQVQAEIDWLRLHSGIFAKNRVINDAEIWLKLNLGQTEGLDEILIDPKDNKHLFWCFLLKIQQNELREAQAVLNKITDNCLNLLGQGLLSLAAGKPQDTIDLWEDKTEDFRHLTQSNQVLWHLAMSQAEIALNKLDLAKKELQYAQKMEPKNPACLTIAFEIALKTRKWDQAIAISKMIENYTSLKNPIYLTKKALLALQLQDSALLENTISELESRTAGSNYTNYIKGIQALNQGSLDLGKSYLSNIVRKDLDGILMADVEQALAGTKIRLNSEKSLQPIIMRNGE